MVVSRRIGIGEVARLAGVSKTAVSFAFNSPERLRAATADRIRAAAAELGYRPHPVARMLTARATATIGLLTPQSLPVVLANPFFALFAEGMAEVCEAHGYGLLLVSPLHGSLARAVARASVDGFVALGLDDKHPDIGAIDGAGLPLVMVDEALSHHPALEVDDEDGARQAAEHLLELGHRDVLVVGISYDPSAAAPSVPPGGMLGRRLQGYATALQNAGLALPPERVVFAPASLDGGVAALGQAWETGMQPTGVLVMSDVTAAGILSAARERGLDVPRDLSVVGFDDLPLARLTQPPLTTVHQPVRRKGEEATRLLLQAIAGADVAGAHRRLETSLVIRDSTAPPRTRLPRKEGPTGD